MAIADLKMNATEKLDDGLHTVKRVIKQRTHDLEDLRDGAVLRVRHSPLQSVALAVGGGLVLGFVAGLVTSRTRARRVVKM